MKTCATCQYATTRKVWHLFPIAYCGHDTSAHPVSGEPTLTCAEAREARSCESCRPDRCGMDAMHWRAVAVAPAKDLAWVRKLSTALHGERRA